ncbi:MULTISPECIES: polyprenyl synthetase family protein [unclassified Leeuwenhoekiella]|uniref:polyprenyl synthetase family protein n=1 Tax=unclassified Leeuwenhoekiella TaxID=2615029 RepID=UPI000C44030C|nr:MULTISPECIES: polyprenyl synthetase family protein [unclassified Leeuwenhoekiella]MAS71564.1 polyprenyl synthetase [Zunongwangia sp.]MAW96303.1 polyprenyl synthetase [Leeuwenhoekiella sp.]MBA82794.1 polyprenyl synthetase [Leeuwenhoekiella sp.]|tara:strand:+ start:6965 stop:7939 length:975 start_codon:yes stop_codon:yes gene_type:complete
MLRIDQYTQLFTEYLNQKITPREPHNLYEPIRYILQLGGKRLRPVLTLMATSVFEADYKKALDAALAVEVFHNFSLVHDDIMDDAPLRRGQETVHEKWDINTGILSGDAMLINAYQLFENYEGETFRKLAKLFSKTAIEVCEGQQYDIDFESRDDVMLPEYLKMIEYKTAVLVGAALKMGAIVAETSESNCERIYEFGRDLGIAFQLQDDYLDAFGDPETFGKQVGGDIIENKKTFLYLTALEDLKPEQSVQLRHLFSINPQDPSEKIETVKQLFLESGAADKIQKEIEAYTHRALEVLNAMDVKEEGKEVLRKFAHALMRRTV